MNRPDAGDPRRVATWSDLTDREPAHARVEGVDLVVVRYDGEVSVLYGRCLHRGVLLGDGRVDGHNLICGVHGWDYRVDTGISEYDNSEVLEKFTAWVDEGEDAVFVDAAEVAEWAEANPQPYDEPEAADSAANPEFYGDLDEDAEPHTHYIQKLAQRGAEGIGEHGSVSAMGVPRSELPSWDDLQILTAQLARTPLDDEAPVDTELVIGPSAENPLALDIPIFVSDMSFGALSEEAKIAISEGAERAGTGVCSGEGGMLPEEQAANSRYFYEYATGEFGWDIDLVERVQAFHFKAGQGAKTGTGGHLPGEKVQGRIAEVRGLEPGTDAVSPSRFDDLRTPEDFAAMADRVREVGGGIPIGFKLSAQHVEDDIDFALEAGADYVILDGRGGGTGAAPDVFKNNISVPTMAALARARRHLDARGRSDVTLIATGGLRTESDFIKAMALGADGVAVANSAMQAIGCLGMRACDSNNCPVGIATQREDLRSRVVIDSAAEGLQNFFEATVSLMKVMARACGHDSLSGFERRDLTTWKEEIADLTGVEYAGVGR
ncbi:glutamate synthase-related protein [Halobellus limi]|uniref:Archaeal glutamate synthase [NADPH] n=1 Tax=Halobellus limi TaxID=699433 RepID=A0A1H5ZT52_9EURY|nr:glutamate synthase-related protein [Halobellus limi]QCC47958.1 glutamate synthase [Halobellus limi]SEG39352.1 Glutamate synthase domain-containing protein 2 [Halobellus limi]